MIPNVAYITFRHPRCPRSSHRLVAAETREDEQGGVEPGVNDVDVVNVHVVLRQPRGERDICAEYHDVVEAEPPHASA